MDTVAFLKLLAVVVAAGCIGVTIVSFCSRLERLHRRPREAVVVVITGTMGSGLGGLLVGSGALRGLLFGLAYSSPVAFVPPVVRWIRVRRRGEATLPGGGSEPPSATPDELSTPDGRPEPPAPGGRGEPTSP